MLLFRRLFKGLMRRSCFSGSWQESQLYISDSFFRRFYRPSIFSKSWDICRLMPLSWDLFIQVYWWNRAWMSIIKWRNYYCKYPLIYSVQWTVGEGYCLVFCIKLLDLRSRVGFHAKRIISMQPILLDKFLFRIFDGILLIFLLQIFLGDPKLDLSFIYEINKWAFVAFWNDLTIFAKENFNKISIYFVEHVDRQTIQHWYIFAESMYFLPSFGKSSCKYLPEKLSRYPPKQSFLINHILIFPKYF